MGPPARAPRPGAIGERRAPRSIERAPATTLPSLRSPTGTDGSCTCTATACSGRSPTPRTSCRRRWPRRGGASTASPAPRRFAPGFTASPRTAASTPSATAGDGRRRAHPAVRAARAVAARRGHLAAALPRRLARPARGPSARPVGAPGVPRDGRARVRRRPAEAPAPPDRRRGPVRCPRLLHRRGRHHALHEPHHGQGPAAAGPGIARARGLRSRARSGPRLGRRARAGTALQRCVPGRRHRRDRRPAHRRRLAGHAPGAARVPGPDAVAAFLRASAAWRGRRALRLVATRANTQPAFATPLAEPGEPARPTGLLVLALAGGRIGAVTRFLDPGLPAAFGLEGDIEQGQDEQRRA